jgi:tetratricopeptide (TPR) repeat protein
MSILIEKIEGRLRDAEQSAKDGLHGRALDYLDAAEELVDQLAQEDEIRSKEYGIKILNNRGIVFKNLENFDESEECFLKALNFLERNGDLNMKLPVGVHLNLANLLSRKRQYNPALEHFRKALEAAEELDEKEAADIKSKIHNNLALFYCNFGERGKAQQELDKCLECKGGDEFRIDFRKEREAWIRTNLGFIHSELADENELRDESGAGTLRRAALGFFREALEIYRTIGYGLLEARTLLSIATVERRLGMKKEAIENLNLALGIAERLRSERLKAMVLEQCVNFHLSQTASPFGGALDELFALLAKREGPFAERILRRIEDRARRAGKTETRGRIRQKLLGESDAQDERGKVDDPVSTEGA